MSAILIALVAVGCSEPAAPGHEEPRVDVFSDLGGLGGYWAAARDINSVSRVVGEATNSRGELRAFLWTPLSGIADLGTLGGSYSAALAINSSSQVVGWAQDRVFTPRAFLYTFAQGMRDLGAPGDGFASEAYDISETGVVVGRFAHPNRDVGAFVWSEAGGMRALASPQGFRYAHATTVNGAGEIAGYGRVNDAQPRVALFWPLGGGVEQIGTLPGDKESVALAVNSDGTVVGWSGANGRPRRGFMRTRDGVLRDLGLLPGTDWCVARAVSDKRVVVGSCGLDETDGERAFVWTDAAGMHELGSMHDGAGNLSGAYGVNFQGQIVGMSWNGSVHRAVIFPARQQ